MTSPTARTLAELPTKHCGRCQRLLPVTDFYRRGKWYQPRCKSCNAGEKKEWRDKNPNKVLESQTRLRPMSRWYRIKSRYGLSKADYLAILARQDSQCAICRTDDPGRDGVFHVDHCHKTGKVRGLLCNNCNVGIGTLGDSADRLRRAAAYLEHGGFHV